MTWPAQHLTIAGSIPARIWRSRAPGPRPVILSLHGAGGSKELLPRSTALAVNLAGVTLVTIDAALHGERRPPGFDIRSPHVYRDLLFLEIVRDTAQDLFTVVEHLSHDPLIDATRIGIRGTSMGGYTALVATGMDLPAAAVLSIAGGGDALHSFVRIRHVHQPAPDERRQFVSLAGTLDPIEHGARFPPRPVLLIHGQRDPISPIAGTRAVYAVLAEHYTTDPTDCLLLEHAGEHATPEPLERRGWSWLIRRIGGNAARYDTVAPRLGVVADLRRSLRAHVRRA